MGSYYSHIFDSEPELRVYHDAHYQSTGKISHIYTVAIDTVSDNIRISSDKPDFAERMLPRDQWRRTGNGHPPAAATTEED
jgi:hypothetical protein